MMEYRITEYGELVIENVYSYQIFITNKLNYWAKTEFDHNGNRIYYEDYRGLKYNYKG